MVCINDNLSGGVESMDTRKKEVRNERFNSSDHSGSSAPPAQDSEPRRGRRPKPIEELSEKQKRRRILAEQRRDGLVPEYVPPALGPELRRIYSFKSTCGTAEPRERLIGEAEIDVAYRNFFAKRGFHAPPATSHAGVFPGASDFEEELVMLTTNGH